MRDQSYAEALDEAPDPHVVLLGPVPCQGCGAWVEWAGATWLGLASRREHACEPYLRGQRRRPQAYRPAMAAPAPIEPDQLVPAWLSHSERAVLLAALVLVVLSIVAAAWPGVPTIP